MSRRHTILLNTGLLVSFLAAKSAIMRGSPNGGGASVRHWAPAAGNEVI
jgi:hypothetical protein